MASRQAKEKRAEAAAKLAASNISDDNIEREKEAADRIKAETEKLYYQQQQRPSFTRSVLGAAQDAYEQVKEAVTRKIENTAGSIKTEDSPEEKGGGSEAGIYSTIKEKFSRPEEGKIVAGVEEKPTGTVAKIIEASGKKTITEEGVERP